MRVYFTESSTDKSDDTWLAQWYAAVVALGLVIMMGAYYA
jgi:hypothetical protein